MKSQEADIVVRMEKIIVLLSKALDSQYDFANLLKELTLSPLWLPWHLEWWREGKSFVSRLSSEYRSFFISITPINKISFWKKEKITGFEFGGCYKTTGLDDEFCHFKVNRKSDDFPILHWMFLEIQSRWNNYLMMTKRIQDTNKKRETKGLEPLSLNDITP